MNNLFEQYIKIKDLNKKEKKTKYSYEALNQFTCEMPVKERILYDRFSKNLENIKKIAQNDNITLILLKEHNMFNILSNYLSHFRKEKYYKIKTYLYNIFSNIFTLDNKYLEVFYFFYY